MPRALRNAAAPIIREYALRLLSDGRMHSRAEIASYVRCHAPGGSSFTEGAISGALRTMSVGGTPCCETVGHGKYRMIPRVEETAGFGARVADALRRSCRAIDAVCVVNVGALSTEELEAAAQLADIRERMRRLLLVLER